MDRGGDLRRTPRVGAIAVGIGLAMAVALLMIRIFGAEPTVRRAEWGIADFALAALVASPALLARMAMSGRRILYIPASAASVGLAAVFLSGAGIPLLVPGVLYAVAFAKSDVSAIRWPFGALLPAVLIGASAAALLVGSHEIVCYTRQQYEDGRVVESRDRVAERTSRYGHVVQSSGPARPGVVSDESGCTEGAIRPIRSGLSLVGVAMAMASARLVPAAR